MSHQTTCPDCNGTGVFNREEGFIDGLYYPAIHDVDCETCEGSGYLVGDEIRPDGEQGSRRK